MKIKKRLIFGFFGAVIIPVFIISAAGGFLGNYQIGMVKKEYQFETGIQGLLSNSVRILNRLTRDNYDEIKLLALKNPSELENPEYLDNLNKELKNKYSFLIVRKNQDYIYGDGERIKRLDNLLPKFGDYSKGVDSGIFVDDEFSYLIKQQDFYFEEGDEGSIFVVTDVNILAPQLKKLLFELIIIGVTAMVLTSFIVTFWIYRGITKPLSRLREATNKMKYGDLDFSIESSGEDEISQLCNDFDDMRMKMKEYTEIRIQGELENKELISNISHDLKTPITAIKGYVEGIMDGVADTPEKMNKYLKTIYTKANDMTVLIDELSFYSRIDTNTIPYNFRKLNLDNYFKDCMEDIGLDLESKNINITYLNYVDENVYVVADSEQLKRVVNNIIHNSVKYIGAKKGIINVRITETEEEIKVEIEDNGKGIADKDKELIFERFYRADTSRNLAQGGSGLGLAISKKIIEEHGGKIWAGGKEGIGTSIYFTLKKYKET